MNKFSSITQCLRGWLRLSECTICECAATSTRFVLRSRHVKCVWQLTACSMWYPAPLVDTIVCKLSRAFYSVTDYINNLRNPYSPRLTVDEIVKPWTCFCPVRAPPPSMPGQQGAWPSTTTPLSLVHVQHQICWLVNHTCLSWIFLCLKPLGLCMFIP